MDWPGSSMTDPDPRVVVKRVQRLFRIVITGGPGRWRTYTTPEVADYIATHLTDTISDPGGIAELLYDLRAGYRRPVSHHIVDALADFFRVGSEYFYDERGAEDNDATLLHTAFRKLGVEDLLLCRTWPTGQHETNELLCIILDSILQTQ